MWECSFSGQFLSVGKHLPSVSQNQYSEEWGIKVPAFIADLSLAIKNSYNFPKYRNSYTQSAQQFVLLIISIYLSFFLFFFGYIMMSSLLISTHLTVMRAGLWLLRCCRTLVVLWLTACALLLDSARLCVFHYDQWLLPSEASAVFVHRPMLDTLFFNFQLKPR